MMRVGLNGLGRIGRALVRIMAKENDITLCAINELDSDIANFAYLLKYDSLYGRFDQPVEVSEEESKLIIGGNPVQFYSHPRISEVPWEEHDLDVVIEATGVSENVTLAHDVAQRGPIRVVVTNASPAVDVTIVIGVNDPDFRPDAHRVVSSSICDANAVAPILHHLDDRWGIEACHLTTLHPWLSYQNLLDGPVSSVTSPGHSWKDYGLGRASVMNLIPKETTAGRATVSVLPQLDGRLQAISFRVPIHVVSASDLVVLLKSEVTAEEVNDHFSALAKERPDLIAVEMDHLVSSDYTATTQSCIIDGRRTGVVGKRLLKMVTWYDNEWGYSSRVVDLVRLVAGNGASV